ncbi:stevor PIR protein,putative [Plasmodium sp.]|nr:stevor PIR protein,putative [Plasmodium sp.]
MTYYNFKLIIFSILLGTLTLSYKNYWDGLYKNININNGNIVNENNKSREFGHMNEKKSKKNKYPKNNTRTKQKLPVPENENNRISNSKKNAKEKYDKEKEAKSNRTSCFLKYLGTLRKKICNLFVKKNKDSLNLSDKSITENDKSRERPNKKKSSNKLSSSNKKHDKNLVNLKNLFVGSVGVCGFASPVLINWGSLAAAGAAQVLITSDIGGTTAAAVWKALFGVNLFFESSIKCALMPTLSHTIGTAPEIASAATTAFGAYGIAALNMKNFTNELHINYILS